jgi:hypothetical protein
MASSLFLVALGERLIAVQMALGSPFPTSPNIGLDNATAGFHQLAHG